MKNRSKNYTSNGQVRMVKYAGGNWIYCENALIKSFETSPHMKKAVPLLQNPFLTSLWFGSGLGWTEKDFEVIPTTTMSCGGSFRSSWWERSHSSFLFVLYFDYHPKLAIGTMCIRFEEHSQNWIISEMCIYLWSSLHIIFFLFFTKNCNSFLARVYERPPLNASPFERPP